MHNSRYGLFRNVGTSYWSGTQAAHANPPFESAWSFIDSAGSQLPSTKDTYNEALAVRSGQAFPCDMTYNGTFHGNVTVSSGFVCIVNATVMGNVQQSGGELRIVGSVVAGNVQVNGDSQFIIGPGAIIRNDLQIQNLAGRSVQNQICDTMVRGNLQFHNNGAAVEIGSAAPSCAGNIIGGNLEVQNNTGSTAIFDDVVVGNLQDQDNSAATRVFDNFVKQNLQCQNNPTISGGGNSAKQKQGQCSAF
jgi:cytoskeletal protein CcmA (bactofilin family)